MYEKTSPVYETRIAGMPRISTLKKLKKISHGYMQFRVLFKKSEHEFYNRVNTLNIQ